ncbi:amino acid adenylation domain-containing protein, partial [Streptomyces sp. HD]|uniref:amino acid adenylation domain-containing protein n=1 Tax=Streptomyces sp. HD TaxID=3020892 RepID=UPI00232EA832
LRDRLPDTGAVVVCVDAPVLSESAEDPGLDVVSRATPDDLAYVIYTSGSTGTPKGVGVPRKALTNLLLAMRDRLGVTAEDRLLSVTTVMFDISNLELYLPLVTGGAVVLAGREQVRDPRELVTLLEQRKITLMQATPSVWQMVVDVMPGRSSDLHVLTGGEALSADLAARLTSRAGRVTNLYGPTETTIWSLAADIEPGADSVTIGGPIANTELFVMDRGHQPAPVGVPGELWIGGTGVARGYLNRPELTAERFVPHPFSSDPDARVYRTGDLVRRRADGAIEYLGRMDHQVKVRGHRIELGEVESTLMAHEAVDTAVVVVREDTPGNKRLVAYCVPAHGTDRPDTTVLRAWCTRGLPEYMVPSTFVLLDELPLTANKKIDRKALPAPDGLRPELEGSYVAPRTPAEKAIARLWRDVLRVDRVGVHDNFFELGGDSVLSIQFITRARRYGLELTPPMVFRHPTVEQLAAHAGPEESTDTTAADDVPATPYQRTLLTYGRTVDRLLACPGFDRELLRRALTAVVRHHDALSLHRAPDGSQRLCPIAGDSVDLPYQDLTDRTAEDSRRLLNTAAQDLAQGPWDGPLVRGALFDLGGGLGRYLLLVAHAAVMDEESWPILLDSLELACQALAADEEVVLPLRGTSFAAWSARFTEPADEPPLTAGDTAAHLRTRVDMDPADMAVFGSSAGDTSEERHIRLTEVVLTALQSAARDWLREPVPVELRVSGREHPGEGMNLTRTVGCLTRCLRIEPSATDAADVHSSLSGVREQLAASPADVFSSDAPRPAVALTVVREDRRLPTAFASDLALPWPEDRGPVRVPANSVEVTARLDAKELALELAYAEHSHDPNTVQDLVRNLQKYLKELLEEKSRETHGPASSSSFPLAGLDETGLASVLERFSK